jgi:hypothetical protein
MECDGYTMNLFVCPLRCLLVGFHSRILGPQRLMAGRVSFNKDLHVLMLMRILMLSYVMLLLGY